MVKTVSTYLHEVQVELATRKEIFREWLNYVEGGDIDGTKAPGLYYFIKHELKLGLSAEVETRLVAKALLFPGRAGALVLGAAEKAGLFDSLPPSFSKDAAVKWGQLAFSEWLSDFGTSSGLIRESLDLQFVEGPDKIDFPEDVKNSVVLAINMGMNISQTATATDLSIPEVFSVVSATM